MPAGPVTIDTGDALPATFTYTVNVPGTPPYTYDISFTGLSHSGISAIISGLDGNIVNFDATNAKGGDYTIGIRCKITDANGDIDEDIDYYYITVNGIVASWDVAPTWAVGNLEQDATSASSATLTVASGGAAPYNYSFAWQGGSPPAVGMSIVQSGGPTDNIIEISTAGTTPPGVYAGTIIGTITDATGQAVNINLDVTFTVLGMRNFVWSPTSLVSGLNAGEETAETAAVVVGTGGVAPYSYLMYWADQADGFSINVSGADNEIVAVQTVTPLVNGLYTGVIRSRITDSVGNQIEIDLPVSITVGVIPPDFDDLLDLLLPTIDWRFQESGVPIVNFGSAGNDFDLGSAIGTPDYQKAGGQIPVASLAAGVLGDTLAEGWFVDDTPGFTAWDLPVGGIMLIVRYTGDWTTGGHADNHPVFWAEGITDRLNGMEFGFREINGPQIQWIMWTSNFDSEMEFRTLRDYSGDSAFHMVWITQPGGGGGPHMYVDGLLDESTRVIDGGSENRWLDDLYSVWTQFCVGYRGTIGSDGSTSNGTGDANIDIDRIAFTAVAPSAEEIKALYDEYFGLPISIYTDGRVPIGTSSRGYTARYFGSSNVGSELQAGMPNGSLFTAQTWVSIATSVDGRYLAVTMSSTGDKCEWAEWDEVLQRWDRNGAGGANVGWAGGFKTSCDFAPGDAGELLLACGETAPQAELALWNGTTFSLITPDPFSVQHGINTFVSAFYNNNQNIAVGGALNAGIALRKYDKVADDDWDYDALGIDTQPQGGVSGITIRRGGIAVSAAHLAVFSFDNSPATTEVRIYSYGTNGDLTTVATREPGVGAGVPNTAVGMEFTIDGRFLYVLQRDSVTLVTKLNCYDRDDSWNAVTLTGWSNLSTVGTDLTVSPDGKYLMVIFQTSSGEPAKLYELEADGDVTLVRSIITNSSPTNVDGGNRGTFTKAYHAG